MKEQLGGKTLPSGPGQVFGRVNSAPSSALSSAAPMAGRASSDTSTSKSGAAPNGTATAAAGTSGGGAGAAAVSGNGVAPRRVNLDALASLVQKTGIPLATPNAAGGSAAAKPAAKASFADLFNQARAAGVPRSGSGSVKSGASDDDDGHDVVVDDDDDVVIRRNVDADGNEIKSSYDQDAEDDDDAADGNYRDPQAPASLPGLSVISEVRLLC